MRNFIYYIMIFNLLLFCASEKSYGYEEVEVSNQLPKGESRLEREYDFMNSVNHDRDIITVSLNLLRKTSEKNNLTFHEGLTITRPWGEIDYKGEIRDSSAYGIGPVGVVRYQLEQFGKGAVLLDMSGALIFYSNKFPAEGRHYNFMWRIGPKFIYRISENFLLNFGYKLMHVSNGYLSGYHNPAYDSEGFSLCLLKLF